MSERVTFLSAGISQELDSRLARLGITEPTAVQAQAIPVMTEGKSLLFQSETGTGKTYAYVLPLLTKIESEENPQKNIKLMVVAPTFELASQIKTQIKNISEKREKKVSKTNSVK